MGITVGNLPLSTTPLAIVARTDTALILVKEDVTVANWPTTDLIKRQPNSNSDNSQVKGGTPVAFLAPASGKWMQGTIVGYVLLPLGTTTGVQEEA